MNTRIHKWGNSLGLRIPKALADEIGVADGSEVDLTVDDRRLIVSCTRKPRLDLAEMLRAVTSHNLHDEIDPGGAVGRESW